MLTAALAAVVAAGLVRRHRSRRKWLRTLGAGQPAREPSARVSLPPPWRTRLERALDDADLDVSPDEAVLLWGGGIALTLVVAWAVTPLLAVPAVPVAAAAGPALLRARRHRRAERRRAAVPGLLDEVARELRAGGTVPTALDRVSSATGDEAALLDAYRDARVGGMPVAEALEEWAAAHAAHAHASHAADPPGVATAVAAAAGALATAVATGGRSAYAVEGVAEALRADADTAAEARAQGAQGRASAAVLAALAPGSLVLGAVVDPESARVLVVDRLGNAALALGGACELLGVWWMHRILEAP